MFCLLFIHILYVCTKFAVQLERHDLISWLRRITSTQIIANKYDLFPAPYTGFLSTK